MTIVNNNKKNGEKLYIIGIVYLLGILLPFSLFTIFKKWESKSIQADFEFYARNQFDETRNEIENNIQALYSIASLYDSSESVTKDEFHHFTARLLRYYANLTAVVWIPRIAQKQRNFFEQTETLYGYSDFRITEKQSQLMITAQVREEYFPARFIEPYHGNERLLGYDFKSDPRLAEALQKSEDRGQPYATTNDQLTSVKDKQYFIFFPVYRNKLKLASAENRQNNLIGFVGGSLNISKLMENMASCFKQELANQTIIFMYDESTNPDKQLIYQSSSLPNGLSLESYNGKQFFSDTLRVANRNWRFSSIPTSNFIESRLTWEPWLVLILGFLLSHLMAVYLKNKLKRVVNVERLIEELSQEVVTHKKTALKDKLKKTVKVEHLIEELAHEIDERKKMEKLIRESEEKFRKISVSAKDAIIMIDNNGAVTFWNHGAEKVFGYQSAEIIGKNLHETLAPKRFADAFRAGFDQFKHTGQGNVIDKTIEIEAIKKDQSLILVELSISAILIDNKWHALSIVRDITQRKQIEARLTETQRMLFTLMSNLPGMAYRCHNDSYWTMEFISEGCYDLTGYYPSDLINNHQIAFSEIIHGDDRQTVWNQVQTALKLNSPYQMTYRIVTAKGEQKWVWEQGRGVISNHFIALEGFIIDVTERKTMQETLQKHREQLKQQVEERTLELTQINEQLRKEIDVRQLAEQQLSQHYDMEKAVNALMLLSLRNNVGLDEILNQALDVILSVDWLIAKPRGCILMIDEADPAYLTLKAHKGFSDKTHKRCARVGIDQCLCGKASKTGNLQSVYSHDRNEPECNCCIPIQFADASLGTLCLLIQAQWLDNPKTEEFLTAMANVLAGAIMRKHIEKESALRQAQLIQADKMASLGVMVSGIAHEINNPNNYILANAELLAEIFNDALKLVFEYAQDEISELYVGGLNMMEASEHGPEVIQGIIKGSRRIKTLLDDLRAFTRQEKNGKHENFLINDCVKLSISILSNQIKKYTDHFIIDLAENLPFVKGKSRQIEQVVINIILNALQALPNRKNGVWIATSLDSDSRYVVIKVKDEGVGMSQEVQNHIFDLFFTTKEQGSGLGLAISYSILKEHNGILEFESKPNEGATAIIKLPVARDSGD
jgi:PAS domain S-box-containing protein